MSLPEEMQKDRSPELRFSETTPNPSKLVDLIKPTTTVDCWTALHPKYITKVTCDVENNTATGKIVFDAGLYAGQVQYTASKVRGNWQINEFKLPAHNWRFILGKDGNWQWHDHFGHITKDRKLLMQNIACQVLLDDKPINPGQLIFKLRACPELYYLAKSTRNGAFGVALPAGKYIVTCDSRDLNDRFGDGSKSDLIVDIEEGQSELKLKIELTPADQAELVIKLEGEAEYLVDALQKFLATGKRRQDFKRNIERLEIIGSKKCIPLLEKLEMESKNDGDRNRIRKARRKISKRPEKATSN